MLMSFPILITISAKRFTADLTPRKSAIKLMIQEELTKLADADEADEDEEEEARDAPAKKEKKGIKA